MISPHPQGHKSMNETRLFGDGQQRRDWITAEQELLETHVDGYVLSTEGADYVPTEHERELIRDALQGFLVDHDELLSAHLTRPPATGDAAREIGEQARELLVAAIKKHWGPFLDKPARPATANRAAEPAEPVSDEEWLQRAGNCAASLEAIESALRSPGGEEWQPIETAPANTDVLLWRQGWPIVIAGHFDNGEEMGWSSAEKPDDWIDGVPTHWRYPPAPPALDHGKVEA